MSITCMSNPQSFTKECLKMGVSLNLIVEAQECMGKQQTAELFKGKAVRGRTEGQSYISSASIEKWIKTLKYAQEHPDEKDTDPYQAREILPLDKWTKFVELVKNPIDQEAINSWEKMSLKKLGDEAEKYGMTLGIRNTKARKDLKDRMFKMVDRRREKFWQIIEIIENKEEVIDYNLMNILHLKNIAKSKGIPTYGLNKKEIINVLEKSPPKTESKYDDMNTKALKALAKENGFFEYNNLSKTELTEMLIEYDREKEEEKKKNEIDEKDKITMCGIVIVSRESD